MTLKCFFIIKSVCICTYFLFTVYLLVPHHNRLFQHIFIRQKRELINSYHVPDIFLNVIKYTWQNFDHFKMCNSVILNKFTLLYNHPPSISRTFALFRIKTQSPLTNSLFLPPASGNHHSTFCLWLDCSRLLIEVESDCICAFGIGLFHLA